MTKAIVKTQINAAYWLKRFRQSEFGQGATEYAGVIIVAAILILVAIGLAGDFGKSIADGIKKSIDAVVNSAP